MSKYQNIINLFQNTSKQPCKYKTKNYNEIDDDSRGMYKTNSQIKFKTACYGNYISFKHSRGRSSCN